MVLLADTALEMTTRIRQMSDRSRPGNQL